MASMLLADYGADVLKIEPLKVGDPSRSVPYGNRDGFSTQLFTFTAASGLSPST